MKVIAFLGAFVFAGLLLAQTRSYTRPSGGSHEQRSSIGR